MTGLKKRIESNLENKSYAGEMEFPKKNLLIEVTNLCNHACIFCANRKMTREKGMIQPEMVSSVLKQAYELGMREVGFYATGEPLVNLNLENYIKEASDIGYEYIYLTTNGALAVRERMERLVESGLNSIKFSINAIEKSKYILIHGKDELDLVNKNLTDLWNYRNESGKEFKIFVSYVATRYTNEPEIEIMEYFKGRCDEVKVINVGCQHGLTIENKELLMLDKNICPPVEHRLPCNLVFYGVYVTWEGYLTSCCSDFQNYLAYADLNKITMKEAWNCERIKKFRAAHMKGDVTGTLCYNCVNECAKEVMPIDSNLATIFGEEMICMDKVEARINNYIKTQD